MEYSLLASQLTVPSKTLIYLNSSSGLCSGREHEGGRGPGRGAEDGPPGHVQNKTQRKREEKKGGKRSPTDRYVLLQFSNHQM